MGRAARPAARRSEDPRQRARAAGVAFSVAHEIAHLFFTGCTRERYHLRARRRDEYYRTPEAARLERLCDLGAAELLMPEPWFGEAAADAGLRAGAVPRLSVSATALRRGSGDEGPPTVCAVFRPAADEREGGRP